MVSSDGFPVSLVTHLWKGHPEIHPSTEVILVQPKEFQVKKLRGSFFAGVLLEFGVPQSRTDLSQVSARGIV